MDRVLRLLGWLAATQPSLAYEVRVEPPESPRLTLLGPCRWSADQVAGGLTRGWQRDEARAFLRGGPRPAREVWTESRSLCLSDRTLKRAKQDLRIQSLQGCRDGVNRHYWLLPGQELPAELRGPKPVDDLEDLFAPLREKYPPKTPLDEE